MNTELSQTQLRKKNNQLKEESLEVIVVTVYGNLCQYYYLLCGQVKQIAGWWLFNLDSQVVLLYFRIGPKFAKKFIHMCTL